MEKILKEEKDKALTMVKTAGFNSMKQDPYESPFLNLSDTKIPDTSREIFQWCKYYYMFDPLISGAINALANFPVTEVYLEDIDDKLAGQGDSDIFKTYERVLFKEINLYKTLSEIGIDFFTYGNCFIFGEMKTNPSTKMREWKVITRLDPSKMTIDYNPATYEKKYKWTVPESTARIVRNKKPKEEYDKIPDMIKQAVKKNEAVVLNNENIYHFSRATDSMGDNQVWGTPIVANVLKLLMYRNILRQAQEAIAREHIVPMRVYYLNPTNEFSPNADYSATAKSFAQELMKSVKDPNYKVVSPVPVNMLSVGGQGRQLLLTPEIQQVQDEILAGMGVPREFIFGGISYSGSSISFKILENQFITYRLLLKDFIQNFLIKGMARARGEWASGDDDSKLITVKMTDLKMQDDVQQKQLIINLNGAGKCTNEYMWKIIGLDPDKMKDSLKKEALEAVRLEAEVEEERLKSQKKSLDLQLQLQMAQIEMQEKLRRYQMALQGDTMDNIPGEDQPDIQSEAPKKSEEAPENVQQTVEQPVMPGSGGLEGIVKQLSQIDPKYREKVLQTFPVSFATQVRAALEQKETEGNIDMRPMPEQRPPRRDSLK